MYVQNLITEVTELTKSKVLLTTEKGFKDAEIGEFKAQIEKLEADAVTDKDETVKTWQTALAEKDAEVASSQETVTDLRRKLQVKEEQFNEQSTVVDGLQTKVKTLLEKLAKLEVNAKPAMEAPKGKKNTKGVHTLLE